MRVKILHIKQLTALTRATSSLFFSILSSNNSGNRARSVRPGGIYRCIRHTKISVIQTRIFSRMERAPGLPQQIINFPLNLLTRCDQTAVRNKRKTSNELKTVASGVINTILFITQEKWKLHGYFRGYFPTNDVVLVWKQIFHFPSSLWTRFNKRDRQLPSLVLKYEKYSKN